MTLHNDKIYFLILAAAGSSSRMGKMGKKEYFKLEYQGSEGTVLSCAALDFLKTLPLSVIIVTIPKGDEKHAKEAFYSNPEVTNLTKNIPVLFITGGSTRQQSVFNALATVSKNQKLREIFSNCPEEPIVLIHDGARPFVTKKIIMDTVSAAFKYGAAVPAVTPADTQKETDQSHTIIRHLVRDHIAAVQTPQVFLYNKLFEAYKKAADQNLQCTDDTEIWGKFCGPVHVVPGDICNRKITYPDDINIEKSKQVNKMQNSKPKIHTGLGYDLHRLTAGRKLMIGGIHIPFEKGEEGHSDGDVLLHAVIDALLGAAGLGDIGSKFPPGDPEWKNADSAVLLGTVWTDIQKEGWYLSNLDCVVVLEQPKFNPFREQVISSIAKILGVEPKQVFVKAKTGEKTGAVGQSEAVEAYASCLLLKD